METKLTIPKSKWNNSLALETTVQVHTQGGLVHALVVHRQTTSWNTLMHANQGWQLHPWAILSLAVDAKVIEYPGQILEQQELIHRASTIDHASSNPYQAMAVIETCGNSTMFRVSSVHRTHHREFLAELAPKTVEFQLVRLVLTHEDVSQREHKVSSYQDQPSRDAAEKISYFW